MNIGSVLSCTPHILESIFQHLTAKDLSNCASVCHLWAVVSQEELQRRREIVPFFQGIKCGRHRRVHRTHGVCAMKQAFKFENELKTQLANVSSKPAFCIAFATTGFLENFDQLFPSYFDIKHPRKRLKRSYWDYFDTAVKIALQKNLPSTCCISLYIENNIVFYGGDSQSSLMTTNSPAICGYLFPKLPDGELQLYKRKEHTGKILKNIITNGQNIKSCLSLVEYRSFPYFQIALSELRHRYNTFASGIIMPVRMASNYVPVFEGPKVQTFRFVIGQNISTQAQNRLMQQWKQTMREKKRLNNSIITFMFSIPDVFDHCFVVSEIFKTIFPDVPLIGLFNCTRALETELNRYVVESGLRYSSVFIFVTFDA